MLTNSGVGLVLEGGGMRGVYTTGALDFFLENGLTFDACYAVSAGACHGCCFFSGQHGRGLRITVDYLHEKRYCSVYSLLTTGDIFGVDFVYNTIPNQLDPYDYEAFQRNPAAFYAVVTNCRTGRPEYMRVTDMNPGVEVIRASSSLPLLSRMVELGGEKYLDGGISDSIPVRKAEADGYAKNVVILTRDHSYRKGSDFTSAAAGIWYRKYPELVRQMRSRGRRYNETLDYIEAGEKAGRFFVLRPQKPVRIKRLEKDRAKLLALYQDGYEDAKAQLQPLLAFIGA